MDKKILATCYYLGKQYPIYGERDDSVKKPTMVLKDGFFVCCCPSDKKMDLNKAIKTFYKKSAKKIITSRLQFYQGHVKNKYRKMTIEGNNSRWGSCDSDRQLTFHWKLMIFPMKAIDYVVVHELCHLMHMNHDRSFWRLVGKIYPDYKSAMAILGTSKTRDL